MRANKYLRFILIVSIIIFVFSIYYYGATNFHKYPDSITYLNAWGNFTRGIIDEVRTPVYPFYLGIAKFLFGDEYFVFLAVLGQYFIFTLSIVAFYSICRHIINSSTIVFGVTLLYAINPFIYSWCACILTESFSICGTVFLLYCLLNQYKKHNWYWFATTTILLIILLMLRPSFVYLLPILFVSWGFLIKKNGKRQQAVAGIASTTIAMIGLFIYMFLFQQQYGIFSTSCVSTNNNFIIYQLL